MNFTAENISYSDTNRFSNLVVDYVNNEPQLQQFISFPINIEGFRSAIKNRKQFSTDRRLLHQELTKQYAAFAANDMVKENINALLDENTFTVCTAHQPNIFTGPLYFIYKILHAARLAGFLKKQFPQNHFVPVYYMGSEDADLDELGHIHINGAKYKWETDQQGAVGRMKVDVQLLKLIDQLKGQLSVEPFGKEIVELVQSCYAKDETIEACTFNFVHRLFGRFGLIVLLPDVFNNLSPMRSFL